MFQPHESKCASQNFASFWPANSMLVGDPGLDVEVGFLVTMDYHEGSLPHSSPSMRKQSLHRKLGLLSPKPQNSFKPQTHQDHVKVPKFKAGALKFSFRAEKAEHYQVPRAHAIPPATLCWV